MAFLATMCYALSRDHGSGVRLNSVDSPRRHMKIYNIVDHSHREIGLSWNENSNGECFIVSQEENPMLRIQANNLPRHTSGKVYFERYQ
jgi:hypothetical protein